MTGLQTMGAETVVEVWLNLPINNSRKLDKKLGPSYYKQESLRKPPNELIGKKVIDKIEKEEAVGTPPKIKMEEPLIITEATKLESQEEITDNSTNSFDSHEKEMDAKPSQGFLNDIDEIFKDAAAATTKIEPPVKLKTMPAQQKKTLVRCLDSNGKILFLQLQMDPNNPKNIKLLKTPSVIATTQSTSLAKPVHITQLKLCTPIDQKRLVTSVTNSPSNTSNSPNQNIKMAAITSSTSILNSKPNTVKSNVNLSRLNPVEATSLMENKKVFIVKSSTLPNLNATNPPPLVRISNPKKIVLAPNLKVMQPNASNMTINSSNIMMKNGKIIVVDKEKVNAKPKQESLLKPQISLLKPVYQKQNTELSATKLISIPKQSSQILGYGKRKPVPVSQNVAKRDYHKEFQTIFLRHRFQTVRSAVEYLLRNTPLTNTLSSKPEFYVAFPFVAESHEKFNSFPFPKRRLNEVSSDSGFETTK